MSIPKEPVSSAPARPLSVAEQIDAKFNAPSVAPQVREAYNKHVQFTQGLLQNFLRSRVEPGAGEVPDQAQQHDQLIQTALKSVIEHLPQPGEAKRE